VLLERSAMRPWLCHREDSCEQPIIQRDLSAQGRHHKLPLPSSQRRRNNLLRPSKRLQLFRSLPWLWDLVDVVQISVQLLCIFSLGVIISGSGVNEVIKEVVDGFVGKS